MTKSKLLCLAFLRVVIFAPNASAGNIDCTTLGRYECRHSTTCTLTCDTSTARPTICQGEYKCQPKMDRCEKGLSQDALTKESCEDQPGCKFQFASCYCGCEEAQEPAAKAANMPICNCACGHGPPSHCVGK